MIDYDNLEWLWEKLPEAAIETDLDGQIIIYTGVFEEKPWFSGVAAEDDRPKPLFHNNLGQPGENKSDFVLESCKMCDKMPFLQVLIMFWYSKQVKPYSEGQKWTFWS